MEYTGKLKDGSTFEESEKDQPLEFTVGEEQIIPGIEKAVEGMNVGDEKTVAVSPEDAYGSRDATLVTRVAKGSLPEGFVPREGMLVALCLQTGDSIPATIVDVTDNDVVVDLNHPLAGKGLSFDIKIVDVKSAEAVV